MTPLFYRLGLTGYPVAHSISPALHEAALAACGLSGEYCLYPVSPAMVSDGGLDALAQRLRSGEIHGLNITVPHKQAFANIADELSPAARKIGAVNTLFMRSGRLVGDNSDAPGFLADLKRLIGDSRGHALILGAGGSARAVVYALIAAGWQVTVAARRIEQASALVASYKGGADALCAVHLTASALGGLSKEIDLVVNCTPLGMWPRVDSNPWPGGLSLPAGAAVYDLVYNPPKTSLVAEARDAGLEASSGLGMLIEQAALAFACWTGETVPRKVMWKAAPQDWVESSILEEYK